ncbi:DegT/DnrJ/EryC1/StrS family aminotransferase [Pseudoclavibacter terrae]|uniref:DegT/DnrJ/EryC1/StrS family aminotransferase n=1 Tax=Pseudoclavibacter terrae TaxID=1530195 RepID=UPI00232C4BBC|nr:DegT/DnrJ/EryC1/StrS family aminotransferase [Pseudoclavibacter terrae]
MTVTLGQPLTPDPQLFAELAAGVWDRHRWTNDGPLVRELEQRLGAQLGWRHAVATSSGTTALTMALLALDLVPGGEVVTTPLTFRATSLAIEAAGLKPVFAAVDESTLCLHPAAVEESIGPRTVAILPVHLFGLAADPLLDALGEAHRLPVVYDAAHAFGFDNITLRGSLTAYSLHATKILHTGEGGLVSSESPELAERVRMARNFGLGGAAESGGGGNAKLPELSAAVGLAQFTRLGSELDARRALRAAYEARIEGSQRVRRHEPGRRRGLVTEVLRCEPAEQAELLQRLSSRGIMARGFPALCADGQRYAHTPLFGAGRPEMSTLAASVLALPFHSRVRDEHLDQFADAIA